MTMIIEMASIGMKGHFVIGSLVQVIPRERIQFRLGQPGKVEDVHLLE